MKFLEIVKPPAFIRNNITNQKDIYLLTGIEYIESTSFSLCCSTRIKKIESTLVYVVTRIFYHSVVMWGLEPKTSIDSLIFQTDL